MKRIVLITALSIAGSMSASAQPYRPAPSPQVDRRDDYRDYDGADYFERERAPYQRFERTRWHREFQSRWVTLANGYAANTTRQNKHMLPVDVVVRSDNPTPALIQKALAELDAAQAVKS